MPDTILGAKMHILISTYIPFMQKISPMLCLFKSSLSLKKEILEAASDNSIELASCCKDSLQRVLKWSAFTHPLSAPGA